MKLDFFQRVSQVYSLGDAISTELLINGIDDQNYKLTTTRGCYVVKVFSESKTIATVYDHINNLQNFHLHHIPVPKLLTHGLEEHVAIVEWGGAEKRICVLEFFDAPSLADLELTERHISDVVKYMLLIHNLPVTNSMYHNYDSWGTANLKKEFELKQKYLPEPDWRLIKPVVDAFESVSFDNSDKSIIHGDLRRDHVLKLGSKYMILDLGCVDYNHSIIDFAIFNAFFCFDLNSRIFSPNHFVEFALNEYIKEKSFSDGDIEALDILIKSTWAAFLIASSFAVYVRNDSHPRIAYWLNYSRKLLSQFGSFHL